MEKNYHRLTLILIVIMGVVRLFFANLFNLIPQEAYYWNWSKHLDLSYFDHPPVTAYLIRFFTLVGGDQEIFVRLPAILLSVATAYIIYQLGRKMYNEKVGFYAAILMNLSVIFAVKGLIVDPDSPLFFFWALTLYFTYQAINTFEKKYWYVAGIAMGFSYLSKYLGFLLPPSVLLFLLLSNKNRKWLRSKEPYLAFIISVIIFTPVIIWNSRHGWVSFNYQFSYRGTQTIFPSLKLFVGHILSQMGIISPLLFIGLVGALIYIGKKGIKEQDDKYLFLFSVSLPTLLIFFCLSPFYWIKAHWPVPGYLPLFIAFAGVNFNLLKDPWVIFKGPFLRAVFYSGFLLIFITYFSLLLPPNFIPSFSSIFEGWEQMGNDVSEMITKESSVPFIFTANYKLASEINFYTRNKYEVYANNVLDEGAKAYDYWGDPNNLINRNAIYAFEKGDGDLKKIKRYFYVVEEGKPSEIIRNGKFIKRIRYYLCYGYKGLKGGG